MKTRFGLAVAAGLAVATLMTALLWHRRPLAAHLPHPEWASEAESRSHPRPLAEWSSHPEYADFHKTWIANTNTDPSVGNLELIRLGVRPRWLTDALVQIVECDAHSDKWRNYAVQHLSTMAIANGPRSQQVHILQRLVKHPSDRIGAIALFSLHRVAHRHDKAAQWLEQDVESIAIEAMKPETRPALQSAALRIAAHTPSPRIGAAVLSLSAAPIADAYVRVSLIQALAALEVEEALERIRMLKEEWRPAGELASVIDRALAQRSGSTISAVGQPVSGG